MNRAGGPPVFLVRRAYRRRRIGDAARMLPLLGLALFLLPAAGLGASDGAARIIYLFAAWVGLVLVSALISRALIRPDAEEQGADR